MSLVLTPPNSYLSGLSVGLPRLWVRVHIPRERPKHSIHPRSSKISKFTSMAQHMLDMARRQQRNEVELNQLPQVGFGEYVLRPVTIGAYSWRRNVTYASCHYCKKAVKEVSGGYECMEHGWQSSPNFRFSIRLLLSDGTNDQWTTAFNEVMQQLVSFDANMFERLKTDDEKYQALSMMCGLSVQVKIKKSRSRSFVNYVLTDVKVLEA